MRREQDHPLSRFLPLSHDGATADMRAGATFDTVG